MVNNQLAVDPAWTIFENSAVGARQTVTPKSCLGRVNGTVRVVEFGAILLGAGIGSEFGIGPRCGWQWSVWCRRW